MTEQEVNNLIESKIGKVKMSQLPETDKTGGLYSIGYIGNQSVKFKTGLLQGDPLTVRKTYQTEAEALADKNPIDATTSLPLTVGQFVSIVDDGGKNGIYRIASIDASGTMSLELQGKLGDLSYKADHGYTDTPKTLKQVEIDSQINSLKNNVFNPEAVREGLIVNNPNGSILPYPSGLAAVTYPIPIPKGSTQLFLLSDQFVGFSEANLSYRNDIGDGPAQFLTCPVNGTPTSIPSGYKYVVVSIARNNNSGAVLDVTNIKIGFNTNYENDYLNLNLIDPESFTPKIDESTRFLSEDFNCFQMYKDSKEDQTWVYTSKLYKVSDFYRSIVSMELVGFDKSLPHKLTMIRRNAAGIQDYSIMISKYADGAWERAAYFIRTRDNIEVNTNGINLFEQTVDGKSIRALIDYSYIEDGFYGIIMDNESNEPNFIIKPGCFKDDGFIKNSLLSFIGVGENKFNSEDILKDYYIDSSSGKKYLYRPFNRVAISNDIEVPEGKTHIYTTGFSTNSSTSPTLISCMDENKSFIGYTEYATVPKELPSGTRYVAVPLYRNINNDVVDPDWSNTMIAFTTGETIPYQEYKEFIMPKYIDIDDIPEDLDIRINDIEQDIVQIKESVSEPFDMSKVIGNLPVSTDGTDIDSGYAYIEESTNIIKVK